MAKNRNKVELGFIYNEPIAIVGIGAIMPDANNIHDFWQNIMSGKNSIKEVPINRWDPSLYHSEDRTVPDKTYSKIGAFVENFKLNPMDYRIPPNVLEQIDPVQQLALAAAKEALEDANYTDEKFPKENTAVIIGNSLGGEKMYDVSQRVFFPHVVKSIRATENFSKLPIKDQTKIIDELEKEYKKDFKEINEDTMPGDLANIVAGRIAASFNLRGKNITSDAACASSLAAIDIAVKGLQTREYDAAVCGGADRSNDPTTYVKFSKIGALSADGSYPFDDRANGFVQGEGAGMMILKRLSDAEKFGDKIYAIIAGVGSSSDGKGKGITAPNPIGQELAVKRAFDSANLDPKDIQLLEAHGTSTSVGDFVEISTIQKIYLEAGVKKQSVKLGSIKSQIGHLKSAAGAAGLLKAILAIYNKKIPPSINFKTPNKKINWELSPFKVSTKTEEWLTVNKLRRAAVSSFGFGGTNFHVILEEYRKPVDTDTKNVTNIPEKINYKNLLLEPIKLSANDENELITNLKKLRILDQYDINSEIDKIQIKNIFQNINFDFQDDIKIGFSIDKFSGINDFIKKSEKLIKNPNNAKFYRNQGIYLKNNNDKHKIAYLFTGQGSQYADMFYQLYLKYDIFKETIDLADNILNEFLGDNISNYIFCKGQNKDEIEYLLKQTQFTQPALLTVDIALYRLLEEFGLKPDAVSGHSLGEYAALVAAEVISFEDGLMAVAIRGKSMNDIKIVDKGKMASINTNLSGVQKVLSEVKEYVIAANKNSNNSIVISGSSKGVNEALKLFENSNIGYTELNVSCAFHSKIVEPANIELSKFLDNITFNEPKIPITANVTGEFFPLDPNKIKSIMKQQIGSSVEWIKQINTLYEDGINVFIEIGPKRALASFVDNILEDKNIITTYTNHPKKGDIRSINEVLAYGALIRKECNIGKLTYTEGYQQFLDHEDKNYSDIKEKEKIIKSEIMISGVGLGLPGKNKEIFAKDNINKIIRGENLIEKLPEKELEKQLNKNIRRLIKKSSGEAEFYSPKSEEEVIRLAGQAGEFDISDEFGVNKEVSAAFDVTTSLAIAAGLEALKDAGIPLIREFKKTSTGSYLPGDYVLPKTMQDDTGIIFASAFPGLDSFSNEIGSYAEYKLSIEKKKILEDIHDKIKREEGFDNKNGILSEIKEDINYIEENAKDYIFNRKILLEVLSFGHAQFAQLIKAKGPNTQVNSACASATQAIGIAEDWIRNGRAKRVIVISADDITTQNNFQWLGTGFLASGAATIKDKVDEAALPFDNRRSGMIIGMGAAAFVIETKKETKERGVEALVKILGTHFSNSAHHATRLDTKHVSYEMNKLLRNVELMHNISKEDLSNSMMFMSHETYTPKRGGSAAAEIRSLRENFADGANNIHIANTKGFTGHPMGAGLEDAIAIKSLEKNRIPPIANFKNPDPDLGNLRISKGGTFNIKYALRLAAGFGSQIAFALYEKNEYKLRFTEKYKIWLKDIGGAQDQLFYDGKTLKMEINEEDYIAKFNKIEIETNNDKVTSNIIDLDYDAVLAKIQKVMEKLSGYPIEMLDPELDIEADLGIDTVKMAETVGELNQIFNVEQDQNMNLGEYNTINKIANYYVGQEIIEEKVDKADKIPDIDNDGKIQIIQKVMSELSGYPIEMLDPELDIEADLGIDTVKMAESVGELNEIFGKKDNENMNLADYNTINKIAKYYSNDNIVNDINEKKEDLQVLVNDKNKSPNKNINDKIIENIQIIISKLSGYPVEMLDPELDIEADLGIDTVKMAESVGEMNRLFNAPEDLSMNIADYNTINKIAEYYRNLQDSDVKLRVESIDKNSVLSALSELSGYPIELLLDENINLREDLGLGNESLKELGLKLNVISSDNVQNMDNINTISDLFNIIQNNPVETLPENQNDLIASDKDELIYDIISEITGYPISMMNADIILDTDLGIDEKTFEIIKEKIVNKTNMDISEITKSTKIGEIISKLKKTKNNVVEINNYIERDLDSGNLVAKNNLNKVDHILNIIVDKTGYPMEMLDPDLDLESDLGIDTVKQAEIFAIARTDFGVPLNENLNLSDFNTINKIANYFEENILNDKIEETLEINQKDHFTDKDQQNKINRYILSHQKLEIPKKTHNKTFIISNSIKSNTDQILYYDNLSKVKFDERVNLVFTEEIIKDINIYELFTILKENINMLSQLMLATSNKNKKYNIHSLSPGEGAIGGMFKSLSMEYDHITAKILVFEHEEQLYNEIGNSGIEIFYENGTRYEITLMKKNLQEIDFKLPEKSVLLASGGAQGITFELVKSIVKENITVILLGRTKLNKEIIQYTDLTNDELKDAKMKLFEKLKNENSEKVTPVVLEREWNNIMKQKQVFEAVKTLENLGCEVLYQSADVTNKENLQSMFENIKNKIGEKEVSHFIHGAGIEISRATKNKSLDEFRLVYDVKALGFENIMEHLNLNKLKLIVGFSSVAGRFGNAGQIDYSAANEYLAKSIAKLGSKNRKAIVIDWSAWKDIGMATKGSTLKVLESLGVTPIDMEDGIKMFKAELAYGDEKEVVIAGKLGFLSEKIKFSSEPKINPMIDKVSEDGNIAFKKLSLDYDKYLNDHRVNGTAILPGVMGLEKMAEFLNQTNNKKVSRISNIKFRSPIKLLKDKALNIHSELKIKEDQQFIKIKSKFIGPDGKQLGDIREHFQANLQQKNRFLGYPTLLKNEVKNYLSMNIFDKGQIYDLFFHGPSYQVLESVSYLSNNNILAKYVLPEIPMYDYEVNYQINPLAIEAAFQAAGLHFMLKHKKAALPTAIDNVHLFETKKKVVLIRAIFLKKTKTHAHYNVELIDENGDCKIKLENYSMIVTGEVEIKDKINFDEDQLRVLLERETFNLNKKISLIDGNNLRKLTKVELNKILDKTDVTQYEKYKTNSKKNEFLAGRLAAKLCIAKNVAIDLSKIAIKKDKNRAPYTIINDEVYPISITHSNGFALAIMDNAGIDLEKIENRNEEFLKQAFSNKEIKDMNIHIDQSDEVTKLWTIKEAYLKKIRLGLKKNLHEVIISKNNGKYEILSNEGKANSKTKIVQNMVVTLVY